MIKISEMKRKHALVAFFLIVTFVFVSSAIDFFHNHKTVQEPLNCPAGQFLKVFLSTGAVLLNILVLFILIKIISSLGYDKYKILFVSSHFSRSPPLV